MTEEKIFFAFVFGMILLVLFGLPIVDFINKKSEYYGELTKEIKENRERTK